MSVEQHFYDVDVLKKRAMNVFLVILWLNLYP